jgi:hypothetical protein
VRVYIQAYADTAAKDALTVVVGRVDDDGLMTFTAPTRLGVTNNATVPAVGVTLCALGPRRFAVAFNAKSDKSPHGRPTVRATFKAPPPR